MDFFSGPVQTQPQKPVQAQPQQNGNVFRQASTASQPQPQNDDPFGFSSGGGGGDPFASSTAQSDPFGNTQTDPFGSSAQNDPFFGGGNAQSQAKPVQTQPFQAMQQQQQPQQAQAYQQPFAQQNDPFSASNNVMN